MSRYVTEIKRSTAMVYDRDFVTIFRELKNKAVEKYRNYGWYEDVINSNSLMELLRVFNIRIEEIGEGFYIPVINDVYVSMFFEDMIKIFALYTTGSIIVEDQDDEITKIIFSQRKATIKRYRYIR